MSGKHVLGELALLTALAFMSLASAADAGGGPGGGPGGKKHGNPIEFILKHATDLNLTADQTTKLKALEEECKKNGPPAGDKPAKKSADSAGQGGQGPKGPPPEMEKVKEILTPDQMDKLKELHKGDHPKPPKP